MNAEDLAAQANDLAARSLLIASIAAGVSLFGLLIAWRAHRLNLRNTPRVEWVVVENRIDNLTGWIVEVRNVGEGTATDVRWAITQAGVETVVEDLTDAPQGTRLTFSAAISPELLVRLKDPFVAKTFHRAQIRYRAPFKRKKIQKFYVYPSLDFPKNPS